MDTEQTLLAIFPEDCDPPPDNELTCPICHCLLRVPVECCCRHVFCKRCIMQWLDTNSTCPLCPVSLEDAALKPAHPLIQSMVGNVKVKCRSPGCSAKVAVSTYLMHLGVCEFKEVPCPHGLCKHRCPRRTLGDHVKTCPHRMLTCHLNCRATMSAGELENHSCMLKLKLRETRARLQKCQQEACDIKCDRDGWERKAEDASRKLESVRNDLAKTTADRDSWKRKAVDANNTLGSLPDSLARTTANGESWKCSALLKIFISVILVNVCIVGISVITVK